uniref:C-type lectin domain-containing protein n=2 Tax=Panagrolaimus TaxID=55784 RepID=A0A914PXF6_9BILA
MEDIYIAQQAVTHFTNSLTSDFWFGLNKMENNAWSWIDGTKMEYSNWDKNEPYNHTDNICGAIAFAGAHWSAQDCYKVKPFVCEFKIKV